MILLGYEFIEERLQVRFLLFIVLFVENRVMFLNFRMFIKIHKNQQHFSTDFKVFIFIF